LRACAPRAGLGDTSVGGAEARQRSVRRIARERRDPARRHRNRGAGSADVEDEVEAPPVGADGDACLWLGAGVAGAWTTGWPVRVDAAVRAWKLCQAAGCGVSREDGEVPAGA